MLKILEKRDDNFNSYFVDIFGEHMNKENMWNAKMSISRINIKEVKLTLTLLILSLFPVFISGTGGNMEKVTDININNQVSTGANDTVSDNNQNITSAHYGDDERIPKEVDHFFLLIMSIIIFFMQCGFAFMEAGAVR